MVLRLPLILEGLEELLNLIDSRGVDVLEWVLVNLFLKNL